VKDPDRFKAELDMPLAGPRLRAVTEEDIEADGQSFMAFATAFGIKPPAPNADEGVLTALPSS